MTNGGFRLSNEVEPFVRRSTTVARHLIDSRKPTSGRPMGKRAWGAQRSRVVHEAARIICEDGLSDYRLAKQKAVQRLGLGFGTPLPSNADIQPAAVQCQR